MTSDMKLCLVLFTYKRTKWLKWIFQLMHEYDCYFSKIIVVNDGPKTQQDHEQVHLCRERLIALAPNDFEMRFLEDNVGSRFLIPLTVESILQNYDGVIVLEDDCLPTKNFFQFTLKMLKQHHGNQAITAICGHNQFLAAAEYSYQSTRFVPWGWATWSDTWPKNFHSIEEYSYFSILRVNAGLSEKLYKCLQLYKLKHTNFWHWDIVWNLHNFVAERKALHCSMTLVTNLGFDEHAQSSSANTTAYPSISETNITTTGEISAHSSVNFARKSDVGDGSLLDRKYFRTKMLNRVKNRMKKYGFK